MAVEASATIRLRSSQTYPSPATEGGIAYDVNVADSWSSGNASGEVDRPFRVLGTLVASGTVTYNLLAAGALKDALNNTVDIDELKFLVVRCLTGNIAVTGVSSGLACFTGTDQGVKLAAGHAFAISFGAAGLAIGSNGSIKVAETSTTLGATFELALVGAE